MAWILFTVPNGRRGDLDTVLGDDQLARQSRTIRDAASAGGPAGELYVLMEGSSEAIARAEGLLAPVGRRLPPVEAEPVYRRLKDEEENASAGMGLFFTE
ncbi:MAG: hypothetical protein ACREC5_04295 [Thermoplasmata archaeon]